MAFCQYLPASLQLLPVTSAWRWLAKQPGGNIGQSRLHLTLPNIFQDMCQAAPGGRNDQSGAVSNPCESWQSLTLFDPKPKPTRSPANRSRIKKKLQIKVRWTVNTDSMIYGTAAFFIFPCSAVKQLAIPLSGKCCQRSGSGRGIHQTDLEPAS